MEIHGWLKIGEIEPPVIQKLTLNDILMTEKPVSTQLLGLEAYPLRTNTRFQGPPGFNSGI
jgi:hypothetical protein